MSETPHKPPKSEREAKLAQALRANLRRRKGKPEPKAEGKGPLAGERDAS